MGGHWAQHALLRAVVVPPRWCAAVVAMPTLPILVWVVAVAVPFLMVPAAPNRTELVLFFVMSPAPSMVAVVT